MSKKISKRIKNRQRVSFYLERDAYASLQDKAARLGISGGLLYRMVLMEYLNKNTKEN